MDSVTKMLLVHLSLESATVKVTINLVQSKRGSITTTITPFGQANAELRYP